MHLNASGLVTLSLNHFLLGYCSASQSWCSLVNSMLYIFIVVETHGLDDGVVVFHTMDNLNIVSRSQFMPIAMRGHISSVVLHCAQPSLTF